MYFPHPCYPVPSTQSNQVDPWKVVIQAAAWTAVVVGLLACVGMARGGTWGPGGCGPVGSPVQVGQPAPQNVISWYPSAMYPGWYFRTEDNRYDGKLLEWFNPAQNIRQLHVPYKPAPANPPKVELSIKHRIGVSETSTVEPDPPTGVNREALDLDRQVNSTDYHADGRPVTRQEALDLMKGADFPDDSTKPRVTVFGDKATVDQVVKDIDTSPALAKLKSVAVVKSFTPDNWYFKDVGPDKYAEWKGFLLLFSRPDSAGQKVEHAQWSYNGPDDLRKAADAWEPSKTPDLRTPPPVLPNFTDPSAITEWAKKNPLVILLSVGGVLYYLKKRKDEQE